MAGFWIHEPKGVFLGEHDLVVVLCIRACRLESVQASLVDSANLGLFGIVPLVDGLGEVTFDDGRHVDFVKEVAKLVIGEDIGLVLDVQHLDEEVGGGAWDADEEKTAGIVFFSVGHLCISI